MLVAMLAGGGTLALWSAVGWEGRGIKPAIAVALVSALATGMVVWLRALPPGKAWEVVSRYGISGALAIAWTSLPAIGGFVLLYYINSVSQHLQDAGNLGILQYVAVFVVAAGLGLLPTYAQAILGGWAFGFWIGLPAALAGFTGASIIGYVVARTFSRDRIEELIETDKRAFAVRNALVGQGFWKTLVVVTLIRVPPNSPFALTNLILAGVRVKPPVYALGTAIGMLPRTAIAVWLASQAASEGGNITEFMDARPPEQIVLMVASAVLAFGVLYYLGNKAWQRVTRDPASGTDPDGTHTRTNDTPPEGTLPDSPGPGE